MTAASKMLALAERCEKASGADGGLDAAIRDACDQPSDFLSPWHVSYRRGKIVEQPAPYPYTASLDAALLLVPEDAIWTINYLRSPKAVACVSAFHQGSAATPALALAAASLRARAAQEQGR